MIFTESKVCFAYSKVIFTKLSLFNQSYKKWGWIFLVPFLVLGLLCWHQEFSFSFLEINGFNNLTDELAIIGLIISLFLIGFSKVKEEDEMIYTIRAEAMRISIYINYLLIIIATLFIYDWDYLGVMAYNLFTPLLIYVSVFHFKLFRLRKL
ncbi:MAG: hypothetical protein OXH57_10140 [Ekhidna sp.]|nr:hypothetical protein [Ekhidna sp.]